MMGTPGGRQVSRVLSTDIDVLSWDDAIERLSGWAQSRSSRYVCITNVHSVVTAQRPGDFGAVLAQADMVTPDGAPVAWMMRRNGISDQQRINGPDLMWRYFAFAAESGQSVYLYGGAPETLQVLTGVIAREFPALKVAGWHSPPFRALTPEEDAAEVDAINASGAGTVWVSLGCPKQERWMAAHRGRIQAPMIGVGAAFDYHAGTLRRAPVWMRDAGLEWFYRLVTEPRRLWRRYFDTNTHFIWGAFKQLSGFDRARGAGR